MCSGTRTGKRVPAFSLIVARRSRPSLIFHFCFGRLRTLRQFARAIDRYELMSGTNHDLRTFELCLLHLRPTGIALSLAKDVDTADDSIVGTLHFPLQQSLPPHSQPREICHVSDRALLFKSAPAQSLPPSFLPLPHTYIPENCPQRFSQTSIITVAKIAHLQLVSIFQFLNQWQCSA